MVSSRAGSLSLFYPRREGPSISTWTSLSPSAPSLFMIKSRNNQIKGLRAAEAQRQSLPLRTFFF